MERVIVVGNPRFFMRTGPHPVAAVASAGGCLPPSDDILISGLASLVLADPDEVSFVVSRRHAAALTQTRAGAVLVDNDMLSAVPSGTIPLITSDPMLAWAKVASLFHPAPRVNPGIHPSAIVDDRSYVDGTAEVCAQAVIEPGAEIGPGCKIGAAAVIGTGVVLGSDCRIGAHASISHAVLGSRVYIYPGARIGQEGFGFSITPHGFQSVPQLGSVIIEDDVEVGANSTIDRGALGNTVIGAGTRLGDQVQIAHGVRIGRYCSVAAMAGISGSTELGDFVVVQGQVALVEHVRVGTRSRIGAQSLVISDLDPGAVTFGSPARPARDVFREIATLQKLARAGRS